MMEEKQLDFNAPLMSVRRFSSTSASSSGEDKRKVENSMSSRPPIPFYKSELKSGPVRNPGVVPFIWEQIPGKPKDEGRLQSQLPEQSHIRPKLPPGRIFDVKQQHADKESENSNVVMSQNHNILSSSYEKNAVPSSHQKVSCLNDNVIKMDSLKEGVKEELSSDSDDDNNVYSDALDTLSQTESFFFNCSISGLSGLDGPDMKPSGTFLTDPQTRDFMMGRFLPAARAMTSETPQYASRKRPVAREQPRPVKKMVSADKRPPLYQYKPANVERYLQEKMEVQSEDEDDDHDVPGNLAAKACGLLPRLCLRNSFCLLNPVPGMKVRTTVPASSVRKVRAQAKITHAGSHCEDDDKDSQDSVNKHKLARGLQALDLHEDESKMTDDVNQVACWSDSQAPDSSSLQKTFGGGSISPFRNEAPQSPFHEGTGFLGIPKEVISFKDNCPDLHNKGPSNCQEILSHLMSKEDSESGSLVVEKTLYVDSVNLVESQSSNSVLLDTRGSMELAEKGFEILGKGRELKETSSSESAIQDICRINISDERGKLDPKILEPVHADIPFPSDRSNIGRHVDKIKGFRQVQNPILDTRPALCSEVLADDNLFDQQQPPEPKSQGISYVSSFQSPLPPPLPKSPSESWLLRTLPSISSRKPSSYSYLGSKFHLKKQAPKTLPGDPKWENIVKTHNVHHYHLRFSEELITPVSQQPEI